MRQCGSAEGNYRPGAGEVMESRREPGEVLMPTHEALNCQRALQRVPDLNRVVLAILYVPAKIRPEHALRLLRIPPRLSQERHLTGLKMFNNLHRIVSMRA